MRKNQLLEISLTVEDELVEPVAEVLARFVKGGVAIESTAVTATMSGMEGRSVGPLHVYGYLSMDDQVEETRQRLEEALWYLGCIRPLPETEFRVINESDWAEAWKKHYHPIPISKRLLIVPAWIQSSDSHRIPIRIDPGMAFGTGTHPTTQLCLEMVEKALEGEQALKHPIDVIDIGTGTAILAIAAIKLGARHALGVDIDPDAVRAAEENVHTNQVEGKIELDTGSLNEIQSGKFSIQKGRLVLANILAPICIRLLDEGLASLLDEGSWLVLSGILDEQAADVEAAAHRKGLRLDEILHNGDWVALRFSLVC
jgi:ribosomal protein L11 methyltransferase